MCEIYELEVCISQSVFHNRIIVANIPEMELENCCGKIMVRVMEWNDEHTTLICKLLVEQVRKENRPNTHLKLVGYTDLNVRVFPMHWNLLLKKITKE